MTEPPIGDDSGPWGLPETEPTTLIALWPHPDLPTQTEVLAAASVTFARTIDVTEDLDEEGDMEPDEDVRWHAVVELPGHDEPVIVWVESAKPLSPDEIDDPRALACRWIIGAESLLDPGDAPGGLRILMRLLAGSYEEIPAVLDANSGRWHSDRTIVRDFLEPEIDPPADAMWMIHVVKSRAHGAWLHTHGLWRCGLPELEMLRVPDDVVGHAAELMNALASRLLEEPMPDVDEPFVIGVGMNVAFRPWQSIVDSIPADVPGGSDDRSGEDNLHGGPRAVVGDVEGEEHWPSMAVKRIGAGDGVLFLARRTTERAATLARRSWPEIATAFASLGDKFRRVDTRPLQPNDPPAARFVIKAGITVTSGDPDDREHLWFIARSFEGDRVEAILVNDPLSVDNLEVGDVIWIDRNDISDWTVITPDASFGPDQLDSMHETLDRLRETG